MFCTKCGKPLQEEDQFCASCGEQIPKEQEETITQEIPKSQKMDEIAATIIFCILMVGNVIQVILNNVAVNMIVNGLSIVCLIWGIKLYTNIIPYDKRLRHKICLILEVIMLCKWLFSFVAITLILRNGMY